MMIDFQTADHCPPVLLFEIHSDGRIIYTISNPERTPLIKLVEVEFCAALDDYCCERAYFRSTVWEGDVGHFAERAGREEALKEILRGCSTEEFQMLQQQYRLDLKNQGYYLYFWEMQMIEFAEHRTYKDIYNFLGQAMVAECQAALDSFNGGEVFFVNLLLLCVIINDLPTNSQSTHEQKMNKLVRRLMAATGSKSASRFVSKYLPNMSTIRRGYEDYTEKASLMFFVRDEGIMYSAYVDKVRKPVSLTLVQEVLERMIKYLRYDLDNPGLLTDLEYLYLRLLKPAMSFTKYYFSTAILMAELSRLYEGFDEEQLPSKLNPNLVKFSSIEEQYQNVRQQVLSLQKQISSKYKTKHSLLLRAMNYIEENYDQGITVADIANSLYVSGVYLSKVFGGEFHMSVIEYLIQFRIKKAEALLMDTDDPVYGVAEKVGFHDARHFTKTFKRIVGETPVEYRKHKKNTANNKGGTMA